MRICPNCRLITADERRCAECGWNIESSTDRAVSVAHRYTSSLRYMSLFSAAMFAASFIVAFSMKPGATYIPAFAAGLFAAGFVADVFLVWLIYRAAALFHEAKLWTLGAVLTFPFGTVVFGLLLARRVRLAEKGSAKP